MTRWICGLVAKRLAVLAAAAAVAGLMAAPAAVAGLMAAPADAAPAAVVASHAASATHAAAQTGLAGAPASLRAAVRRTLGTPTRSAAYSQQAELTPSHAKESGDFGWSVSLSADGATAVIGAFSQSSPTGAQDAGAAYVFTRSGATWIQKAKLTASDGKSLDEFGFSVALSGDGATALVGTGVYGPGAVYVFTRRASTFAQTAKLTDPNGKKSDDFGSSMALSGDGATIVVGAAGYHPNRTQATIGAAYVFTRHGATWTPTAKLTASDGASNDFGGSVAVSADGATILVGATAGTFGVGAVNVFTRHGATWIPTAKLTGSVGASNEFGGSVAVSGDGATVLVGDIYSDDTTGAAYVFTRNGATWTQKANLTVSEVFVDNNFAAAVSLSGNGATAVVAADGQDTADGNRARVGAAYVFTRTGTTWSSTSAKKRKLTASNGRKAGRFGKAVAVSGDGATVLVGAPFEGHSYTGATYVFVQ